MKVPKHKSHLTEVVGWYGVGAILLAYFLISFNLIKSNSLIYQFLNLTGAFAMIEISFVKKLFQSVFLNFVWSFIAIISLIRILFPL